jgi:hypothetical protein
MDMAAIHTVGPRDIIGEHGQHAVYVPRVKAIVDAFKDFDLLTRLTANLDRVVSAEASPGTPIFRGTGPSVGKLIAFEP